jgi:hypothetical protein
MKYAFGDVKVFDKNGKLKRIVKAKTMSKKMWKNINHEGSFIKTAGLDRKEPQFPEKED